MCPANERRCYNVMLSLIGCAHTQNDPWRKPWPCYKETGLYLQTGSHFIFTSGLDCCLFTWTIKIFMIISKLRPEQNGKHLADSIFICIFLEENINILLQVSMKFIPMIFQSWYETDQQKIRLTALIEREYWTFHSNITLIIVLEKQH